MIGKPSKQNTPISWNTLTFVIPVSIALFTLYLPQIPSHLHTYINKFVTVDTTSYWVCTMVALKVKVQRTTACTVAKLNRLLITEQIEMNVLLISEFSNSDI